MCVRERSEQERPAPLDFCQSSRLGRYIYGAINKKFVTSKQKYLRKVRYGVGEELEKGLGIELRT